MNLASMENWHFGKSVVRIASKRSLAMWMMKKGTKKGAKKKDNGGVSVSEDSEDTFDGGKSQKA